MQAKLLKLALYGLLTWTIYLSPFIGLGLATIGRWTLWEAGQSFLFFYCFGWVGLGIDMLIRIIPVGWLGLANILTVLIIILIIYTAPLLLWWKIRNIYSAYVLALTGTFCGPYVILLLFTTTSRHAWRGFIAMTIMYAIFWLISRARKRFWPNLTFAKIAPERFKKYLA